MSFHLHLSLTPTDILTPPGVRNESNYFSASQTDKPTTPASATSAASKSEKRHHSSSKDHRSKRYKSYSLALAEGAEKGKKESPASASSSSSSSSSSAAQSSTKIDKLVKLDPNTLKNHHAVLTNRDLFLKICSYLPIKKIAAISRTCKIWQFNFLSTQVLLKDMLIRRCEVLYKVCMSYNEQRLKTVLEEDQKYTFDNDFYAKEVGTREKSWQQLFEKAKTEFDKTEDFSKINRTIEFLIRRIGKTLTSHDNTRLINFITKYGTTTELPPRILIYMAKKFRFPGPSTDGEIPSTFLSMNAFITLRNALSEGAYSLNGGLFRFCNVLIDSSELRDPKNPSQNLIVPFGDTHLPPLLEALKGCRNLKELNLSDNELTDASVPALEAFCKEKGIVAVNLENTAITHPALGRINRVTHDNWSSPKPKVAKPYTHFLS